MTFSSVRFKTITGPAVEPVTLAETKAILSITDSFSDDELLSAIKAAREVAEDYTGRSFITRTLELALDSFYSDTIDLPRGPVQSITSVKYIDTDGTEQTYSSGNYSLDDYSAVHRVVKAYNANWPSTRDQPNAVKVRYVAGDGDESTDIDERVKRAHYLAVQSWLRCQHEPELGPMRMPMQFYDLLSQYRLYNV